MKLFARICSMFAVTAAGLILAAPAFAGTQPQSWAPTGVSTNDLCPSRVLATATDGFASEALDPDAVCPVPRVAVWTDKATVAAGEGTIVRWTTDTGWGCYVPTTTGSWTGTKGQNGSEGIVFYSPGVYRLGLICSNDNPQAGYGYADLTVVAAPPPPPPPPPPGGGGAADPFPDGWLVESTFYEGPIVGSPGGYAVGTACRTVDYKKTARSVLARTLLFQMHHEVRWCWKPGFARITEINSRCYVTNVHITIQAPTCPPTTGLWVATPYDYHGGWSSVAANTFKNCVPLPLVGALTCFREAHVTTKVWVYARGSWRGEGGD